MCRMMNENFYFLDFLHKCSKITMILKKYYNLLTVFGEVSLVSFNEQIVKEQRSF